MTLITELNTAELQHLISLPAQPHVTDLPSEFYATYTEQWCLSLGWEREVAVHHHAGFTYYRIGESIVKVASDGHCRIMDERDGMAISMWWARLCRPQIAERATAANREVE